jgi:hypothetical protein
MGAEGAEMGARRLDKPPGRWVPCAWISAYSPPMGGEMGWQISASSLTLPKCPASGGAMSLEKIVLSRGRFPLVKPSKSGSERASSLS